MRESLKGRKKGGILSLLVHFLFKASECLALLFLPINSYYFILIDSLGRHLLNRRSLVYVLYYVCVFIKLNINARSGPVILVILCHSH